MQTFAEPYSAARSRSSKEYHTGAEKSSNVNRWSPSNESGAVGSSSRQGSRALNA